MADGHGELGVADALDDGGCEADGRGGEQASGSDMKGSLGLRPVFHHREDRIRSHVQLCWLG
ncbi:MAG: hypothetical protein M0Z82_02160, partial [Actinomycetota bacterium]|nr:hypothetical protein [Actinomycetota bacterium]